MPDLVQWEVGHPGHERDSRGRRAPSSAALQIRPGALVVALGAAAHPWMHVSMQEYVWRERWLWLCSSTACDCHYCCRHLTAPFLL
jgi:hypothetical protein